MNRPPEPRLFVDDERPAPQGWLLAKTSSEAIAILQERRDQGLALHTLSLDHDLGGDDTTRPVVLWMCEHDWWPENAYVHTGNPIGEQWLVGMIRRYAPAGTLVGYGLNFWGTGPDSVIRHT